ncbi:MAG: DNA-binding protein [Promethearchaeota archaeon]|nr:MAG: DNA-binding protein [Candidatus Lokiarchaeota archaeon]
MKSIETSVGRVIIAKIEPNEDLIESITEIIYKHNIKSGLINVIGAFKKITIGYFDMSSKNYNFKTFDEEVELISCIGNISYKDNEPIVHLHVTLGREDYNLIGGHLSQPSIISVTAEVYIYEINQILNRSNDPRFDLSLLDL